MLSSPIEPIQRKSGSASLIRAAIGAKSRLPNSYSRNSTTLRPRAVATSRAPSEMKCTDGNLLVTTAIVFGGFAVDSSASMTLLGTTLSGSWLSGLAGNCIV